MDEASLGMSSPPFGPGDRASGILLHVTSLPSPYGIGDLGPSAFAWVDRLARAGQSWWQALPLGPTGYGDSPYQPLSVVRGQHPPHQPRRPDRRTASSARASCEAPAFPTGEVDYPAVTRFKHRLLERAWSNFRAGAAEDLRPAFERFCLDQAHWLDDYALFRALKIRHGGADYLDWPEPLVRRDPAALDAARRELADLDRPGPLRPVPGGPPGRPPPGLRPHARGPLHRRPAVLRLARLGGRVGQPASSSSSMSERRPRVVAGVPPDYFSPDGPALGQPRLRLGGPPPGGIPLVDRPPARPAGPRGRRPPRPLPRLRRRLARPGRRRHGPRGPVAPRARARISSGPPGTSWAGCRSSPRTWGSSRPTSASSARTCTSRG